MLPIRVLIVDDSAFVREVLETFLSQDDEIKIIGTAENGQEGVDKVKALKPDFVTMDIRMPVMDGMEAIERIMMTENAVPILVISDVGDAKAAYTALSKGALEVIPKSDIQPEKAPALIQKVKLLSKVKVIRHIRTGGLKPEIPSPQELEKKEGDFPKVVAIASSTGGPKALSVILSELPKNYPYPIVIAQHIDDGFVGGLVDWVGNVSPLTVKRGMEGERLAAGTVYISSANKHMEINKRRIIRYTETQTKDIFHPSCNKLLLSVASIFKENSIGVILTGMSDDGVSGMESIKGYGGVTVAQDEESCIVFGMPKEAIASGCIDRVLSLEKIGLYLKRL